MPIQKAQTWGTTRFQTTVVEVTTGDDVLFRLCFGYFGT